MTIDILTPEKQLFSGEVKLAKLPGMNGAFEILSNHAPIISSLEEGEIKIVDMNGAEQKFKISGGIVEQSQNKIIVLAE